VYGDEPSEEAVFMRTIPFVQSIYEAFSRGDIGFVLSVADPNITWISNADPALLSFGGERRGIDGVESFFRERAADIYVDSYQPLEFVGGPDFVVVLGRSINRSRRTGESFEDNWMHLFRIKDWKLIEFRGFNDTHALVQAHFGGDIHSITVAPSEATAPFQR
jgi:ketosteroid isomerase-like protein